MEQVSGSVLNINQNGAEKFRTQMQADAFNKALNKDGKAPVKQMGKDQFLQLLITELRHQDPTNPMNDREFISQMAQFTSMEQMMQFNKGMTSLLDKVSFQSSFDLLGMNVAIESQSQADEQGNPLLVTGTVDSVSKKGTEIFVKVNGEEYPSSEIMRVDR